MRPRRLKLGTRVDNALIHPCIFSFFFLPNFQALKIFVGVFLETVRPRRLKFHTNMNSG